MKQTMLAWGGMARGVSGLGPGRRSVIWVAGCSLRCAGCMTPELLPQRAADMPVERAVELLLSDSDWDGRLTISGGEPFEQAGALVELVRKLRQARECEILVYSGRRIEELRRWGPDAAALLSEIDMLIDGPFEWTASNRRVWRGSDNQRFHALSDRGLRHRGAAEADWSERRPLSIQWVEGLGLRVIGIPRRAFFGRIREVLAARSLDVYDARTLPAKEGGK